MSSTGPRVVGTTPANRIGWLPCWAAEIVRPGGKFTSVSTFTTSVRHVHSAFVPAVVAPNGHKLADLLFKVAAQGLRSQVDATVSFDQVGYAVSFRNDDSGRIVVVR
jgi:hypothetical protein